ncbi:MAG: SprT family zinc-dependent metalloprotease [Pseudomonadota bacterium]
MFIDKGQKMTVSAADGRPVPVRLEINPKARRLILRVDPKAREGVAVAPSARMAGEAAAFAAERADWIQASLDGLPRARPFEPGADIPVRGESVRLSLEGPGRRTALLAGPPPRLAAPGAPETFGDRVKRFLKGEARADLSEAVARHARTLGVDPQRISVKDTRSRWGSCTSDGRLSFSWRLILAPPDVLDYVAAHECAHLLEMNHSPRFWAQVTRCVGDPKAGRRWLRQHGEALHAYGA